MADEFNENNENNEIEEVREERRKPRKGEKQSFFQRFSDKCSRIFVDYRGEYKKIIWPSRETLIKQTVAVLVVCAVITVIIAGLDSVFSAGQSLLSNLFIK